LHAQICWRPAGRCSRQKYFLKHGTQTSKSFVSQLESRINMTTLEPDPAPQRWRSMTLAPSA